MLARCIVSPTTFKRIWIGVAASYLVCGTILAAHGLLYVYVLLRAQSVIFSVELLGVNVQPGLYPYMGSAALVIASIHLYHLVTMLFRSMKSRSLQFSSHYTANANGTPSRVSSTISSAFSAAVPSGYVGSMIRSLSRFAMSLWKAFDVMSPNYGVVYILREIIQTGIQTQQAYMMSAHVAQAWMNHTIVFLLVLNCWAMPLIKHGLGVSSTPTSRLLCLILNLVLDFVSYFALPIVLLTPYAKDFDPVIGSYGKLLWYKDVWFMQLKNGWPLVFATSIWDGFSRLLIAFSMTRTLRAIAKLLVPMSITSASPHALVSVSPNPMTPDPDKTLSRLQSHLPPVPVLRSNAERWGHRALTVWGLVVLALHIQASSTPTNPQCLLQVRPWFVRRPVCSLMEMNCYRNEMSGNAADFDATLDSIDCQWLSYLIIRHCNAVEITPRIHDLSWLMGIKIYNSTLVQWDTDAALTQTHHPNVAFAFVISTNVTSFPPALYHDDFPFKLRDIEFSYVNLTEIPSEVANVWHPGTFLVMEGLQLPAFPDVLTKLQPSLFSVASNNFTGIPTKVLENPEMFALILNDNPISELPTGDFRFSSLSIAQTKITKIPTWLDTSSQSFELWAGSTPLCEALHQRNATALGLTSDAEMDMWQRFVDCTPVDGLQYLTHFPLGEEPTNNPSRLS